MMLASTTRVAPTAGLGARRPLASPCAGRVCSPRRAVAVRFQNPEKKPVARDDAEQLATSINTGKETDTTLTPEQIEELRYKDPGLKTYYPSSNEVSPRTAEMRADLGNTIDIWQAQTFDGPAVETSNGRLCMLAVPLGLYLESTTGQGLWQQTLDHPLIVAAVTLTIIVATYVPILKGYTRKEPYANRLLGLNFSPQAENWNGRLAMLGFAGMVLGEWITSVNTLQAWGLQGFPFTL